MHLYQYIHIKTNRNQDEKPSSKWEFINRRELSLAQNYIDWFFSYPSQLIIRLLIINSNKIVIIVARNIMQKQKKKQRTAMHNMLYSTIRAIEKINKKKTYDFLRNKSSKVHTDGRDTNDRLRAIPYFRLTNNNWFLWSHYFLQYHSLITDYRHIFVNNNICNDLINFSYKANSLFLSWIVAFLAYSQMH